jgi:hypothetical protein
MLRKNINLGNKKVIPLRRLADRNDMALGFFGVVALPRSLSKATTHIYYKTCHSAKRNEESQINSNKNLLG